MDEIGKSLLLRMGWPGLLEEMRGMLFYSALGHLLLLLSLGILASQPSGRLPPPIYRVNLVELFEEGSPRPPVLQPRVDAPPAKAPTPRVPQIVRSAPRTPKTPPPSEIRSPSHRAKPKPQPLISPAAPSFPAAKVAEEAPSPAPSVEKTPRSSRLKMVRPVPRGSGSSGIHREVPASVLQPAAPPPVASAGSKALESLLKEGISNEDLPSLSPSPASLAPSSKGKAFPAPAPKGLRVDTFTTPAEVKKPAPASPPSWLTASGTGEKGRRPSTGALASLPPPEGEEIGLSRPATPLSKGTQGAGAIQPKASMVPLLSPQSTASAEGKKRAGEEKIAPYLLGEAANSASTGSTSSSQRLPTLSSPSEKAGETFTPAVPQAKGGSSPKGVGLEPLLSQEYISLDTKDPQWAPWVRQVKERIKKVWRYPEEAEPGLKGVVEVSFTVERDGSVGQVEILNSSGYPILDHAAMEALKRASPLQPLPSEVGQRSVRFGGKFKFNVD